jgi:hypothetical protein
MNTEDKIQNKSNPVEIPPIGPADFAKDGKEFVDIFNEIEGESTHDKGVGSDEETPDLNVPAPAPVVSTPASKPAPAVEQTPKVVAPPVGKSSLRLAQTQPPPKPDRSAEIEQITSSPRVQKIRRSKLQPRKSGQFIKKSDSPINASLYLPFDDYYRYLNG